MVRTLKSMGIAIGVTLMMVAVSPAMAGGSNLLSGVKFSLWSTSGSSTDHHRERGERITRNSEKDCWYENRWQKTRHGKRLEERVRVCS